MKTNFLSSFSNGRADINLAEIGARKKKDAEPVTPVIIRCHDNPYWWADGWWRPLSVIVVTVWPGNDQTPRM